MKTVGKCALVVADYARHQPHDGVGHHGGSQLTAGEHIVADGYLTGDEMVAYALVDAFVVAGEDNQVARHRQVVGNVLVELLSVGTGEDYLIVFTFGFQSRDGTVDGFALHHHAGEAAVGVVVHTPPLVGTVVTEIVQMNLCQTFLLGTCQYRFMHESFQHLGQYGNNVYSHVCKSTKKRAQNERKTLFISFCLMGVTCILLSNRFRR